MYVDKLSLTDPFSLEGQGASGRIPPARYRPKFLFIFMCFSRKFGIRLAFTFRVGTHLWKILKAQPLKIIE